MVQHYKWLSVVVVGAVILAGWGCLGKPSRVHAPGINASAAGAAAMKEYDTDGDGKVAGAELDKAPSLKAALKNLDTDGDGAVSAAEVTARIQKWQASKVGMMALACTVKYQGRPLEGATVTFEPETFLGSEVKPAAGTTGKGGTAAIRVIGGDVPGVACGLYKVKITCDKVAIPPKYNTETTLGQEVSLDAPGIQTGIVFDLK